MTTSRIALIAAVCAATLWCAKSVAIGTAGGLDRSPLEGPLFLAGLAAFVVASVSLGLALTRDRATWARVLTGVVVAPVVGVAVTVVLVQVVDALVDPTPQRHWAWAELNLWVVAAAGLALALVANRRRTA